VTGELDAEKKWDEEDDADDNPGHAAGPFRKLRESSPPTSAPYAVLISGFEVIGQAPVRHPMNA